MKKFFFILCCTVMVSACASHSTLRVGEERDVHGCIPSAGYTWSRVAGACLRLWEEAITLQPAATEQRIRAYAVISADGSRTEVFLPEKEPVVMKRSFTPDGPIWSAGEMRLERRPEGWRFYEQDVLLFQAGNPPAAN